MQFKKTDLQDMLWGESEFFTIVRDEIIGKGRWSIHHEVIFQWEEKLFRSDYNVGATEYQEESPWEYDGDLIECDEVIRVPITTYDYLKKTELNAERHIPYIEARCPECFKDIKIMNVKE